MRETTRCIGTVHSDQSMDLFPEVVSIGLSKISLKAPNFLQASMLASGVETPRCEVSKPVMKPLY